MSRISHGFSDIISRFVECNHALSLGVISARLQLQKRYTMAIMWLCMCEIDQFFNLLANQWFIQLLWCFSCWWIYVFSASTLTFYLLFSLVCLRFRHFFKYLFCSCFVEDTRQWVALTRNFFLRTGRRFFNQLNCTHTHKPQAWSSWSTEGIVPCNASSSLLWSMRFDLREYWCRWEQWQHCGSTQTHRAHAY